MSDPLVWLPYDAAELADDRGQVPGGLRFERYDGRDAPPASLAEVEFFVLPYRFSPDDGALLARMPRLRVVQTQSAGVEHIAPAVPEGVLLCNGRGIHDTSTAELALTLVLASLRGIPDYVHAADREAWVPDLRPSLADRRVVIVGYGQIGAAIEERLLPFECTVVRVARHARDGVHAIEALPDLLPDADVVVLIVPGTEETLHLFDAAMLARMRDGALLVNVSRGSVVDTDALVAELESGRLHAALDVVDPEPLPAGHALWRAPHLLLTPHVGGNSTAMHPRARALVRAQLERYAAGEPLENVVTGSY